MAWNSRDVGYCPGSVTSDKPPHLPRTCKIGITHMNQLFVFLAIYTLPASKKDLRQLVIRCCENRHGKSKTMREEKEEVNILATWTNIVSVVNLTLFALDPRKLRAKFIIPELCNPITCSKKIQSY